MEMRLQKFLSDQGVCSRRHAGALIRAGSIFMNGRKPLLRHKTSGKG
ncbi:23S rRNA pseudouridine synthase F, partial [Candidatus Gracilibacteria bacterium]|nr:23S rRNA pseudouridine synthase F [Candidatus Gracilibacteria bacterium]